jgi:CRP/FNR family transcriptional regulator, cyclic AMP receptor protein
MDASQLRKSPLFDGLSAAELERCAGWFEQSVLTAGARLVNEGDFSNKFFVILDGELEVRHDFEKVRRLGPGDFLGEMGLLSGSRRSAKVIALTRSTVAGTMPWDFRAMVAEFPQIATRLEAVAAQRRHDDEIAMERRTAEGREQPPAATDGN